jgi:threonylcarbamoyladenosine tRNA methylthiotransferase MtaB
MSQVQFHFHTLGCKVNRCDSEALRAQLMRLPFISSTLEPLDVCVINTCTVTAEADRKSRQAIRKIIRAHPDALVTVIGCYATAQAEEAAAIDGVAIVLKNSERDNLRGVIVEELAKRGYEVDPAIASANKLTSFAERTRAFVKVGDGCDQYCSYCIIPFTRGHPRSRPPEEITEEVANLVDNDYREVVLCAIKMGVYGRDINSNLTELVRRIIGETGIERIRLSSIEMNDVERGLIDYMANEPRICPHLHLPLQSGSDVILQSMRRPYRRAEFDEVIKYARDAVADLVITSDVMIGYPGESEETFGESMRAIEELRFGKTHLFRYSPRKGTRAYSMPNQIPGPLRDSWRIRAEAVAQATRESVFAEQVDCTLQVLIETQHDGSWWGHAENYMPVLIENCDMERNLQNMIVPVTIKHVSPDGVSGRIEQGGNHGG